MPLPAALAARLAKRGLVKEPKKNLHKQPEEVEEVFAEDYDEPAKPEIDEVQEATAKAVEEHANHGIAALSSEPLLYEFINCPNKSNPYHQCETYCKKRYGIQEFIADSIMVKKRDRHLRKHPLPEGWQEVADPTSNRYYYWNLVTDQVSWLSPSHPKAVITLPAEKLLAVIGKTGESMTVGELSDEEDMETEQNLSSEESQSDSDSGSYRKRPDKRDLHDRDRNRDRGRDRGRDRRQRDDKKGRSKDSLDPMDPASYSDVPRGGWSEGLDARGKAKTGVDVTASGPLFQQRPYPSPGDILRANRAMEEASEK